MEYNTQRKKIQITDYGRNIYKLIEKAKAIENRERRNAMANTIINVMAQVNPQVKNDVEYKHKLWDHLMLMSNYELDVDCPYPISRENNIDFTPTPLKYQNHRIQYRHYGKVLEDLIEKIADYTYTMDVCFTNNPFGGAYMLKKDANSHLQTEYAADTNGNFKSEFAFVTECIADKPVRSNYLDVDSYLVFRTRTRVDDQGRLVSAHYGKICGVWRSTQKIMQLGDGCFNSVENDPNIEGDQTLLYAIDNYAK